MRGLISASSKKKNNNKFSPFSINNYGAVVSSLNFIMIAIESHWRFLSKGIILSGLCFQRSVIAVWKVDYEGARRRDESQ